MPSCQHHWIIPHQVGAKSWGRCNRCGEWREFLNIWEEKGTLVTNAIPLGRSRKRGIDAALSARGVERDG